MVSYIWVTEFLFFWWFEIAFKYPSSWNFLTGGLVFPYFSCNFYEETVYKQLLILVTYTIFCTQIIFFFYMLVCFLLTFQYILLILPVAWPLKGKNNNKANLSFCLKSIRPYNSQYLQFTSSIFTHLLSTLSGRNNDTFQALYFKIHSQNYWQEFLHRISLILDPCELFTWKMCLLLY